MNSNNEMSFLDHLEELRWNIIRSLVAVMVMACVCFIFKEFIFDVIIFGPKKLSFPTYKFLCNAATFVNIETHFCGEEFPFVIQNRTMASFYYEV
jgi:sec-independent protein translocase protein TatC